MSDSQEEKTVSDNAIKALTTGEQLAASRQAKNWTVQFVAEQLKLSQVQIVALEADNFDALPKMVIVRGFVRAYAKLLKVNGDGLVAALPRDTEPVQLETSLRPALSTPFIDSRLSLQGQHDNNRRYIIGAITLLIIVGLFLLLQVTEFGKSFGTIFDKKNASASSVASALAVESASVSTPNDLPATQNAEQSSALQGTDASPTAIAASNEKTVPTIEVAQAPLEKAGATPVQTPDVKATNSGAVIAAPSTNGNVVANTAANAAANPVKTTPVSVPAVTELFVLKFRQDSWIQVKTESGTILSSHLAKAGTEESFSVKQALNVKLGNAAGVDAILRGEPLSVSSDRGNNVANFVVK
ncbi:helix-turn-helix domain-containing protein [Undibacterium flavidum]|uniref:Helix-turn-helix domain-containing protein n=1 Tax=Undibacterium flavidum TaxID=2762297 RepID=A0ABR6YEF2_9BURK|nr:helix-turn-helix domain-containing protein [Undibacterium flavidum]MBC3874949.1 helix-turn-helix domain-containing protein [Undibacterium flavidum]